MSGVKVEYQTLIMVNHNMADHRVPERVIKIQIQQIQFIEGKQASADLVSLDLPPFLLLLQCFISGVQLLERDSNCHSAFRSVPSFR